jgi:hypothetical protein
MAAKKTTKKAPKKAPSARKKAVKKTAAKKTPASAKAPKINEPKESAKAEKIKEEELQRREEELRRQEQELRESRAAEEKKRAEEREAERVRAREERARMKEQRRREQEEAARQRRAGASVTSLEEARVRQQQKPSHLQAVGKDEGPKPFKMSDLHKYKLTVLNTNHQDHLNRLKAPLVKKYNMMMKAELDILASRDAECVKSRREQISCVNEIINVMTPTLPPGYAITQLRAEEGLVVAEYAPDRAGKPLPMPETVTDEG